ncbi:tyrosine-type recombinase/integrase [Halobacteriales archaeon Cl-PHB]
MSTGKRRPPELSPREARDRWLDKMRVDRTESTLTTYYYRLKLFCEWAEENGIESVDQITGWDIESYEAHRRSQQPTALTLNKEFGTLKNWFEYLARIEIIDEDLPEKVVPPDVPKDELSSDVKLDQRDAIRLLQYFRSTPERYGSRAHALLELMWSIGARAGALAALDLRDRRETDDGTRYLQFVNRPQTGTRLKKGPDGERPVQLSEKVWDVLDHFVEHQRHAIADSYGRAPLLASEQGRPTPGTIRDWTYLATLPCQYGPCPHDKDPEDCEWTNHAKASGCPSSRAPHHVRTGSITWQRNRGIPAEVVAERVNSSVETIEQHYDKEDPVEEMLQRRQPFLESLDIDDDSPNHDS